MSKKNSLQAVRGMHDVLPDQAFRWQEVEASLENLFHRYNYSQMRTPILEASELFARSIGEETDIVGKEMYSFDDRSGANLTLRPEGTAGCVRSGIEHGLFYNQQQRLWYIGPMFRHERPQRGRYRQFHQVGVECYGWHTADIEAEVIGLAYEAFRELGLQGIRLKINSLGNRKDRETYRDKLVTYFSRYESHLDEDNHRRLAQNPLRILDSKNPELQSLIQDAPLMIDALSDESAEHFGTLQSHLRALEIDFEIDTKLVRVSSKELKGIKLTLAGTPERMRDNSAACFGESFTPSIMTYSNVIFDWVARA